ncbi:MAG: hypothetical protein ACJAXJ_004356 [Colwellia sp.]|jgi:hypothetical protein
MPHCSIALKVDDLESVESTIKTFAVEQYKANSAYHLDGGMWNIDAGENDVRAIVREENSIIKFFCRYRTDVSKTEARISDFANTHSKECTAIHTQ